MSKIQTTRVFAQINKAIDEGYSTISEQGSSRSGKTWNTVLWICVYAYTHPKTTVSIVRQTLPSLKRSVYRDFEANMINLGFWDRRNMNKSEFIYHFSNGSWIEFFSADNEQKLRGSKRMILYVNEGNELTFLEWQQLQMRTTQFSIIDYNPSFSEDHWICQSLNRDPRTFHFISTYKDNPFLERKVIEEIESLQYKNSSLWRVYGLGMQAVIEGLIFENVVDVEEIPRWAKKHRFLGIDFGYTCFDGDTMITTIDGDKPIRKIMPDDMVLTRKGYRKVLKRLDNGIKKVHRKRLCFGEKTVAISATDNHYFNANNKWTQFRRLRQGDKMFTLSGTMENAQRANEQPAQSNVRISCQPLKDVEDEATYFTNVYDLEIEDVHEYFANGILVHNCDPTAIVEVCLCDDCLYLDEVCYATHMKTSDIINVIKKRQQQDQYCYKVISESADPRMIDEIYDADIDIHPVHKYAGSIMAGITKMLEYKICVTKRSINLRKEYRNYTYRQDKEGRWLNEPIGGFDHGIDAVRYVVIEELMGNIESGLDASGLADIL